MAYPLRNWIVPKIYVRILNVFGKTVKENIHKRKKIVTPVLFPAIKVVGKVTYLGFPTA